MTTTQNSPLSETYTQEWLERAIFWRQFGDRAQMRHCAQMFRWFKAHTPNAWFTDRRAQ